MSLQQPYDPDNIFARIIRGELPCAKVYEDDATLAFMDAFPQAKGHTLVIAKDTEATNLLNMPAERLGPLMADTQKVAKAVVAALKPDGFRIMQFNGTQAGQTVFHLHFHIVPFYEGSAMEVHGKGQAEFSELEALAEKSRAER